MVVVHEALAFRQHVAAVESQRGQLRRFVVKRQLHAVVAHLRFVQCPALHHLRCLAVRLQRLQRAPFVQAELLLCHAVSRSGIGLRLTEADVEVEHHLLSGYFCLGQFHLR